MLRVDWNVRPNTTFYSRLQFGHEVCARGYVGQPGGELFRNGNWPQMQNSYDIDTVGIVNTLLHTFNPSTVLEADGRPELLAAAGRVPLTQRDLDAVNRDLVLPGLPQFFPEANPLNLIPNMTFARHQRAAEHAPSAASRRGIRSMRRTRPGTSPRT